MKTVKLRKNSVSEFIYDQGNKRLVIYKNDGTLPRTIKCSEDESQYIVDSYLNVADDIVNYSKVPMIFSVRQGSAYSLY